MSDQITISKSYVQKISEQYVTSVASNFKNANIDITPQQKQCVIFGVQKLVEVVKESKKELKDLDFSSITTALSQVALSEINMMSFANEAYFVIRGNKIFFKPQGNGARTLVRNFGVNVANVLDPWIVREGDEFKYPSFKGITKTEPEWTPSGKGKCVRIVIPVIYKDGSIDYKIAEREDVKSNLLAAISQNLTQGQEKNPKLFEEILKKAENMSIDKILDDPEITIKSRLSAAWRGVNREAMLITKMQKNALSRIPIDMKFYSVTGSDDVFEEEVQTIDVSDAKPTNDEPKAAEVLKAIEDQSQTPASAPAAATESKKKEVVGSEDDMPF